MNIEELEREILSLEAQLIKADERDNHRAVAMLEDSLEHVLEELDKATHLIEESESNEFAE